MRYSWIPVSLWRDSWAARSLPRAASIGQDLQPQVPIQTHNAHKKLKLPGEAAKSDAHESNFASVSRTCAKSASHPVQPVHLGEKPSALHLCSPLQQSHSNVVKLCSYLWLSVQFGFRAKQVGKYLTKGSTCDNSRSPGMKLGYELCFLINIRISYVQFQVQLGAFWTIYVILCLAIALFLEVIENESRTKQLDCFASWQLQLAKHNTPQG